MLFPTKKLYCATNIGEYLIFKNTSIRENGCVCNKRNINCNFPQYSYKNGKISKHLLAFSRISRKKCKCCLCDNIKFNEVFLPGRYKELFGCCTFYENTIDKEVLEEACNKFIHIKEPQKNRKKWKRFKPKEAMQNNNIQAIQNSNVQEIQNNKGLTYVPPHKRRIVN